MFCKNLRSVAMKIINYEKKEMTPLTNEETGSYEKQKFVIYAKKNSAHMKKIVKSKIIVITQETLEELLIRFVI